MAGSVDVVVSKDITVIQISGEVLRYSHMHNYKATIFWTG